MLILTTFELDEYVYEALRAGASGFLLKRTPADDLIAGIRVVHSGDALLAPSVTSRLIDEFAQRPLPRARARSRRSRSSPSASARCSHYVAKGMSNAEIAQTLVLSEGTVKTHIKRIFYKLGLRDRTQAVIFAYDVGIVQPKSS